MTTDQPPAAPEDAAPAETPLGDAAPAPAQRERPAEEATATATTATATAVEADAAGGADGAAEKPDDPWAAFGPAPVTVPGRFRRAARAVGRFLVHEWTLAALGSLVLAALMTWPTLEFPAYKIPQDTWDPTLQAWQMAWSGHILTTDPAQLWHSNTFFPERYTFAFSDTLLGYAPAGMIGSGFTAAIVRYNIMYVLLHALAFFGAYALVRQLGANRTGAAVAGAAFAYAPWRLAQAGHLHVISTGGIALALAMLARGHGYSLRHGYRPQRRNAWWVLAGWLVATWQLTLGFGIGLPFAYALAGIGVVAVITWFVRRWLVRPVRHPFGWALVGANLAGGLLFAAVGGLLAIPYFRVAQAHPNAERSIDDLKAYSAPLAGLFTAPPESRIWGGLHAHARDALPWHPEMTLLPGFVLYGLALAGLFVSVWKLRHRLLLFAAVLVTMVLAMGTWFFGGRVGYLVLFENLPGWNGLRTSGRLMVWTTLLLGILAAGAVSAFVNRAVEYSADRVPARPGPLLRLATLVPLALVLVEGLNTTPHPLVPAQPSVMRTAAGPILVLPSNERDDMHVMLWSVTGFQQVVNGGSGFQPALQEQIRKSAETFPDPVSVDELRKQGVKTVIVLREEATGTPWQVALGAPVYGLGIEREETADAVIFHL
ncbi:hypothetical protein [Rhizomonospora bruguierae]|uniref:hypothetical protein n=1 Tax=Rhizomonospora bruguierae TaxID=1581705 RepID=UPI001BD02E19|nr:hypothetical protein [Micromonospora sp. NBRC 107566]